VLNKSNAERVNQAVACTIVISITRLEPGKREKGLEGLGGMKVDNKAEPAVSAQRATLICDDSVCTSFWFSAHLTGNSTELYTCEAKAVERYHAHICGLMESTVEIAEVSLQQPLTCT
jgi:hypothetical protein